MIAVEVSMEFLSVLLLSINIFVMMEYWFARQEAKRYKHLYYTLWNWTSVMPENELKEKLYQQEEDDVDGRHNNLIEW